MSFFSYKPVHFKGYPHVEIPVWLPDAASPPLKVRLKKRFARPSSPLRQRPARSGPCRFSQFSPGFPVEFSLQPLDGSTCGEFHGKRIFNVWGFLPRKMMIQTWIKIGAMHMGMTCSCSMLFKSFQGGLARVTSIHSSCNQNPIWKPMRLAPAMSRIL